MNYLQPLCEILPRRTPNIIIAPLCNTSYGTSVGGVESIITLRIHASTYAPVNESNGIIILRGAASARRSLSPPSIYSNTQANTHLASIYF
jgi:hypothetical protein